MNSMDKIMLKLGYIKKERYIKERNRFKKLHKENVCAWRVLKKFCEMNNI